MSADNNTTTISQGFYAGQPKEERDALRNQIKLQKEEEKDRVKAEKKLAAEAAKAEKKAAAQASKLEKNTATEANKAATKAEKKAAAEAAKADKKAEKKAATEAAKVEKKAAAQAAKAEKKAAAQVAKAEKKAAAKAEKKDNAQPDENHKSGITEDISTTISSSDIAEQDSNDAIQINDNSIKNKTDGISNKNLKFLVFAFYIMSNSFNINNEFPVNDFVNNSFMNDNLKFSQFIEHFFKNFNSIFDQFCLFKNNDFKHIHLLNHILNLNNHNLDIDVKLHVIDGIKVLIDKNNIVYQFDNHSPIGIWKKNKINII